MKIISYKTHKILPNENLITIIDRYIPTLNEKDVLAVTSKIVSLSQNRIVKKESGISKESLIRQEADCYIDEDKPYGTWLTIKNNILIPTAGIDESNGKDVFILWPENIQKVCAQLWLHLKTKHQLKDLGIIVTDSHTTPLRRGVSGIGLGWCGFQALNNYIKQPDIWGKLLRMTKVNVVDALAASAVYIMGEGNEQTPLAIISEIPNIVFRSQPPTQD